MQTDPLKRPTMAEVEDRFSKIRLSLGRRELRSRAIQIDNGPELYAAFNVVYHWFWKVSQIILHRPAIPNA